jgi:hypothetical protein
MKGKTMKKFVVLVLTILLLAAPVYAAKPERSLMAQTITLPEQELTPTGSYPPGNTPGVYEVELRTLPGNSIGAEIIMTRTASVNAASGKLATVEVFFWRDMNDGLGARWVSTWGPDDFMGGIILDKTGSILLASSGSFEWPGEAGPDGKPVRLKGSDVKVKAIVFQTFRTSVTINSKSR